VPEPLSAGWTSNIRTLATSGWWDGTSVYRVVDNWVAQWGDGEDDEADAKPLPDTLLTVPESDYTAPLPTALGLQIEGLEAEVFSLALTQLEQMGEEDAAQIDTEQTIPAETAFHFNDPYADYVGFYKGFPIASDFERFWPTHCYASVGVARDLSPNTGTGAELYAVIGNAPRALDRNIAVVGRVIEGIEHLSTLPRGTGGAGVYEDDAQRVPIIRVRMASDMAPEVRPAFRYLDEGSDTFARYLAVLSNRNDAFYRVPAGGVSLCNASVPVERVPEE
jgi:peptidylprolyl isomerase